nr:MAG TPA: hypothetical protein [Bacteriophage sp.]
MYLFKLAPSKELQLAQLFIDRMEIILDWVKMMRIVEFCLLPFSHFKEVQKKGYISLIRTIASLLALIGV